MLVSGGLEHAGGIGRWAGHLQDAWRAEGLTPRLEIVDTRGHGHAGVAALAFARALLRLVQLHRQGRLGVIHANLSLRGSTVRKIIVGLLARVLGVPVVLHLHGAGYEAFYDRLPVWGRRAVGWLFATSAKIVVLGQGWADWVAASFAVPPAKLTILYNGVTPPVLPRQAGIGPCHIVLLGRIGARKGVPELLDALASEGMRGRAWRATLAGDGEVDEYRAMARLRGLADRVTFPGWIDQTAAITLMARCDILVLPSHAENLPMSVIEALAHGVPVIATPVGATPELLCDGVSALFVPVGDAASLGVALQRLIDDPALRAAIGRGGLVVFNEKLDIGMLARRLAALYAEALAQSAPHTASAPRW